MSKKLNKTSLDDRMKKYEKEYESTVPYNNHLIIRLDGHKFSKFTKGFNKPFDKILHNSMVETTKDLVKEFNAVTGYTQSDEITIFIAAQYIKKTSKTTFPNVKNDDICINRETGEQSKVKWNEIYTNKENIVKNVSFGDDLYEIYPPYNNNHIFLSDEKLFEYFNKKYKFLEIKEIKNNQIYTGRIQKIVSLVSAFCTMKFNQHLKNQINIQTAEELKYWNQSFNESKEEEDFRTKVYMMENKVGNAWFDARIYGISSYEEVFNSIMWRVRDCYKNAKNIFSQTYMSHKSLQGLNSEEQIELTFKETGKNFNDMPECFKYGTFVKKENYLKNISNIFENLTPESNKSTKRTRLISLTKPLTTFNVNSVDFVIKKYI